MPEWQNKLREDFKTANEASRQIAIKSLETSNKTYWAGLIMLSVAIIEVILFVADAIGRRKN